MRMIQCPDCGIALSLEGHEPGDQIAREGCGRPIEVPGIAYRPPGRRPDTYEEPEDQDQPSEAPDGAGGSAAEPASVEPIAPDGVPAVPTLGVESPPVQEIPSVALVGDAEEEPPSLPEFEIGPGPEPKRDAARLLVPIQPEGESATEPPRPAAEPDAAALLEQSTVDYGLAMPRLGGGPLTGQPGRTVRRPEVPPAAPFPTSAPSVGVGPEAPFGAAPAGASPTVAAPQEPAEVTERPLGAPEITFGPPPGQTPTAAPLPPPAGADMVAPLVPTSTFGWNWGAFLLSWVWAFANGLIGWGLLGLFCNCGWVNIYLGIRGSQLSWERGRWTSVEQFRASQRTWAIVGLILLLLWVLGVGVAMVICGPVAVVQFMRGARSASGPMAP
ncbi:MAG TPA: hypothetical protein PLD23_17650 [Armatimonadota bacterium]|nr:hypothetical protein [Armatimonadota bacterium]